MLWLVRMDLLTKRTHTVHTLPVPTASTFVRLLCAGICTLLRHGAVPGMAQMGHAAVLAALWRPRQPPALQHARVRCRRGQGASVLPAGARGIGCVPTRARTRVPVPVRVCSGTRACPTAPGLLCHRVCAGEGGLGAVPCVVLLCAPHLLTLAGQRPELFSLHFCWAAISDEAGSSFQEWLCFLSSSPLAADHRAPVASPKCALAFAAARRHPFAPSVR